MRFDWGSPESVLKWLDFVGWKTDRLSEIVGADQTLFEIERAGPSLSLVSRGEAAATEAFLAAALHLRDWLAAGGMYEEGADAVLQGHYIFRRYADWRGWVIPRTDDSPYWTSGVAADLRDCLQAAMRGDDFGWDSVAISAHWGAREALAALKAVPEAGLPQAIAEARAGVPGELCEIVERIRGMRVRWTEIGRATRWASLWHAGTAQFGGARSASPKS